MQWIYQRFEHHEKKRYYEVRVQPDLFGWVIVRNWGGINQATGNKMTLPVASYEECVSKLKEIVTTRKRKQYQPINHYGVMT